MIAIGVILFVLTIFAIYSISTLSPKKVPAPLLTSPDQTVVPSTPVATTETTPFSNGNRPIVYIPTTEEINQSIEDQNQKRKAMEELIAARNKKTEKVMAAVTANLASSVSQETVSENTPPELSPEARAQRNKELRDGIKAHLYFPR